MLDPTAFHDSLSLFYVLLFPIFNDFPELIRQNIDPLMQLILCSLILPKIRELISELIEIFDELLKLFLFGIWPMNEFKILLLNVIKIASHSLSLHSHLSKHLLHLPLICLAQFLPYL